MKDFIATFACYLFLVAGFCGMAFWTLYGLVNGVPWL